MVGQTEKDEKPAYHEDGKHLDCVQAAAQKARVLEPAVEGVHLQLLRPVWIVEGPVVDVHVVKVEEMDRAKPGEGGPECAALDQRAGREERKEEGEDVAFVHARKEEVESEDAEGSAKSQAAGTTVVSQKTDYGGDG